MTTKEKIIEWKKDIGEIPEQTCPDIDKIIKAIQKAVEDAEWIEKNTEDKDIKSTANDIVYGLEGWGFSVVEELDKKLRRQNEQLRGLGKFWYEKCQELSDLFSLQKQEMVEEIEKLKKGEHAEPVLITTILDFTKDFCKKNKLSATEEFDLNYKFGDIDRFCFNYALDQLKQTLNK